MEDSFSKKKFYSKILNAHSCFYKRSLHQKVKNRIYGVNLPKNRFNPFGTKDQNQQNKWASYDPNFHNPDSYKFSSRGWADEASVPEHGHLAKSKFQKRSSLGRYYDPNYEILDLGPEFTQGKHEEPKSDYYRDLNQGNSGVFGDDSAFRPPKDNFASAARSAPKISNSISKRSNSLVLGVNNPYDPFTQYDDINDLTNYIHSADLYKKRKRNGQKEIVKRSFVDYFDYEEDPDHNKMHEISKRNEKRDLSKLHNFLKNAKSKVKNMALIDKVSDRPEVDEMRFKNDLEGKKSKRSGTSWATFWPEGNFMKLMLGGQR